MKGIAYLGPPGDHHGILETVLRDAGIGLLTMPDYLTWLGRLPENTLSGQVGRLRDQIFGLADAKYLDVVLRLIDEGRISTVLAFWGTTPIPEIKALKRQRPEVNFIQVILCHPLGLTPMRVRLQNLILGGCMSSLDGVIVSSQVMQSYLERHVRGARKVKTLILPPFWSKEYAPTVAPLPAAERPNVLFMGRMDWKRGQPTDNVVEPLRELMRHGIDVHFSRSAEGDIADEHAFPFDPMPLKQLANFAAPFDASLIVYNLSWARVTDRFEVTVPDRLITSASAGIPIALPAQGYAACKEYLAPYQAVIEYTSMAHLAEQLRDRDRVSRLKETARRASDLYRAERVLPKLIEFLVALQGG